MRPDGPRVLLIEDDEATRRPLASYLDRHGYRVGEADCAAEALRLWDAGRPDVILLDLGLPDLDGIDVIRRIRREATTPIVILSARGDERDKIAGLEAGADDYLGKPFSVGELNARIRAVLRRAAGPAADASGRLCLGPIAIDPASRTVTVAERPVHLTPREYELLKVLLGHPGRVVTKTSLLRAVWGVAYAEESQYLHVYVNRLRRKLAEAGAGELVELAIATEPGIGYRIADPSLFDSAPAR
jgi:two-component system, OmpR family, KDP operon response regulator KdpE